MINIGYRVPNTLKEEASYYLMEKNIDGSRLYSPVTFLAYSADPTFVYIKDASGSTRRVARESVQEKSL